METPERSERERGMQAGLDPWRFVVLVSKFSVHFLISGLMKSYGVLIPFLVIQLKTSYATIGFIVTSQFALMWLLSPIANLLLRKLNSRLVVVVGSCMASCTLLCTAWTGTSWSMGLCMILSGCCFSALMQYIVIVLRQYYLEFFGFAHTTTHSGAVVGTLLIPFLTMKLYIAYGLYGTLACLAALSLNLIPCGLVLKSPRLRVERRSSRERGTESQSSGLEASETTHLNRTKMVSEYSGNYDLPHLNSSDSPSTSCFTFKHEEDTSHSECDDKGHLAEAATNFPSSVDDEETEGRMKLLASETDSDGSIIQKRDRSKCEGKTEENLRRTQPDTGERETSRFRCICRSLCSFTLEALAYDSLRKESTFSLTMLPCRLILDFSYAGWLFFLVSYAISVGIEPSKAGYLPMVASAGGLVARIGTGLLLLWQPHWGPAVYASLTTLSAFALFAYTINSSLNSLLACSFISGFSLFGAGAVYIAMLSEVVAEENFSGLLAMSSFCTGVGVVLSGFMTGLMFDITGSFIFTFRILGCFMTVNSIVVITYLCCRARRLSRSRDYRGREMRLRSE